jgi:ABC-2 type transport system permease protein
MPAASAQTRLTLALVNQLVRKDLKVKYQGSSLGFMWSLANPLLQMVIYTFVFSVVMKSEIERFGFFLMSGLLVWNFFSMGVTGSSMSILANAGLVKKVPFAHSALPIASIGFAGVQVVLQLGVLLVALVVSGDPPWRPELLLLIPATIVLLVLTTGLGLFVAATTVRFKDTRHLLEVAMFAWMWLTPIIYPASLVHSRLADWLWLYYLNPMSGIVVAYQRALYGVAYGHDGSLLSASAAPSFYLKVLGLGFVVSVLVLALGVTQFRRLSQDFAEDL